MARLEPLPPDTHPELESAWPRYVRSLGFVPNSALIMQRKPKLVQALSQLSAAVWDAESEVDVAFKRLIAYITSRAYGCHY